MAYYLDTSALVKLVVDEGETAALREWWRSHGTTPVSCDLARTELMRAVRRAAPEAAVQVHAVLDALVLVSVTARVFDAAGRLEPTTLRSLDAIHLAAALELGDDLEGIVTYDERLAEAATSYGVPVVAPA
ncbi:type II toxin-antitoxin system VapC family toxin [Cellulomonas sp. zg-ZUI222]|uniref:Ribonuclease VapC n=1 Tax=Cellulomonas wangleii TaxID=2816956 RepID=A0ABX8D4W9_9CELL|nr:MULTISPECIES: type II toxin-antitoxin system VapC family toxin [Cellulomonas]MBO0898919.1 type II toxin-antitoxin system VapC family toxin [Cellulomonas sp. zg-ZUI22]MBO0919781.1 type II toxin-antitoxin system VapC family toxin [Cellulomonas wangleii]MBO0923794.1 type II toxin-antitoxin system VapC family toxin [Cellulomonas wangleii]MBO0924076.1 type II toxin-antitoxin system VapC family toxin [Cellulomonas wangleii]QVI62101.1 type II toxin-antitoxin system VapC family toxin [Cellulomonas 